MIKLILIIASIIILSIIFMQIKVKNTFWGMYKITVSEIEKYLELLINSSNMGEITIRYSTSGKKFSIVKKQNLNRWWIDIKSSNESLEKIKFILSFIKVYKKEEFPIELDEKKLQGNVYLGWEKDNLTEVLRRIILAFYDIDKNQIIHIKIKKIEVTPIVKKLNLNC